MANEVTVGAPVLGQSTQEIIGESNSVANSMQAVAIDMSCYQGHLLKRGDNDAARRWGGAVLNSAGTFVIDLQNDLKKFLVSDDVPDGDFGGKTETALRRFQWAAKKLKNRLAANVQVRVDITFSGDVTGVMDEATCAEMKIWKEKGYSATGNLVKKAVEDYSEFQRGTLSSVRSDVTSSEMVFDRDFSTGLDSLNSKALDNHIKIKVNQVFRIQGAAVSGAVVTPASKSQHLIGHAIDTNLVDGSTTMTTSTFQAGNETQKVKDFIAAAKQAGLRWGGDFGAAGSNAYDPPHFDLQVTSDSEDYDFKQYFNQQQLRLVQPILLME